jgi:hypothetical protein
MLKLECILLFRMHGIFNIFELDIVVMVMGSQLIMLRDFTNGLLRLVDLLRINHENRL